ncbi:MMPL family transporter [Shewanella abyssi]|uniref:efflux RND transporter permease subunit n=1 Tax=Shewanella abyssi TaxID=311789 RepID=UPI00200C4F21|nr:MMPL family transporter [Shewanella abyssi]MCL1051581.1 MMPL family transporter [Shewanella abyssi]
MGLHTRTVWAVQRHPLGLFVSIIFLSLLSLLGLHRLNLDVNFSDYFSSTDHRFVAFKQMNDRFERHDQLWLLLESEQDWREEVLSQPLQDFVEQLQANPNVLSVQGYNQFLQGDARTEKILNYKKHPRLASVLSENGRAILLQLKLNEAESKTFATRSLWLMSTLDDIDATTNAFWQPMKVNSYLNGTHALNWQYAKVLRHDLLWFAPSLLGIIFLMAAIFIRQKVWIAALCLNTVITLILTLGLAAWLKLTLAAISAFVPVIIVTLGLAYASHLYFAWGRAINLGKSNQQALEQSVIVNQAPLFYSTLTTIFGFCLLMFSPSPPIQSFGLLVAFAVLCNYLLSLSTLIYFAGFSKPTKQTGMNFALVLSLAQNNVKRPNSVMLGIALLSVLSLMSVSKLTLNDDPLAYFESNNPFTQSSQKMRQYFAGINLQHYVVSSKSGDQLDKVELAFTYKFARFLKVQSEINKVQHLGDWVKSAGIGQNQFRRLLSENSVGKLRLQSELATPKNASLVTLYLVPMTAMELVAFEVKVNTWLDSNAGSVDVSPPLGSNLLFAHLSIDNANNMLMSFGVALLALAVLLSMLKRSFVFGLMGLLLNFLPLLWVFALWQLNGGFISLGTAVVLGMMLGVIVDDTLHLMLKLPDKDCDDANTVAMWDALSKVLPVITFTTLTIALGFSIGLMSDFAPISQLSLLSCLVVLFAWGFDVLMLPVLYRRWVLGKKHAD